MKGGRIYRVDLIIIAAKPGRLGKVIKRITMRIKNSRVAIIMAGIQATFMAKEADKAIRGGGRRISLIRKRRRRRRSGIKASLLVLALSFVVKIFRIFVELQ